MKVLRSNFQFVGMSGEVIKLDFLLLSWALVVLVLCVAVHMYACARSLTVSKLLVHLRTDELPLVLG